MSLKQYLQFCMGYMKRRKENVSELVNSRKTNAQGNYFVCILVYFQYPSFAIATP